MTAPFSLEATINEILSTRKYRSLGIPVETVRDLVLKELPNHRNPKEAIKTVRKKLHNIVADYLGDPDYATAKHDIETAFSSGDVSQVKIACEKILAAHSSTRERLAVLDKFYERLFALTGEPKVILDLACGLNPLTFPWMGLSNKVKYHAYDIHVPRLELINRFFTLEGLAPLAVRQDVLVLPPQVEADVAFFFKEAHRFEQRQRSCNRPFWQALKVRWLLVSLPPKGLSGRSNLVEGHRQLVYQVIAGLPWQVTEITFENELVFCIDKGHDQAKE